MNGIDTSHNNGVINWDKVILNNPKPEFAIIKATEGVGYIDSQLSNNALGAKRVGLKISYYHFASLNSTNVVVDATAEANYFLANIRNLPKNDLPLVLDIETNKILLPPNQVSLWITTFFSVLRMNGHTNYILYSYTPFLNTNLPSNHTFGDIPLWIAAYVSPNTLKLPNGWDKYWLWQYSASGTVSGINGKVDMNQYGTHMESATSELA